MMKQDRPQDLTLTVVRGNILKTVKKPIIAGIVGGSGC